MNCQFGIILELELESNAHREIFLKSYKIKQKSENHFPIDLAPNGRLFGSKLIGKW